MTAPVTILTREQIGLRPADLGHMSRRPPDVVTGVTFHVTVTGSGDPTGTWRRIQEEYMSGNNVNHVRYGDLPYNDGISLGGQILAGRRHDYVGAHAASSRNVANRTTLGLAVIGDGRTLSPAAERAIRTWLYLVTLELGHRPVLFDHYDWRAMGGIATACPDPAVANFVALLRAEARAGR